DATAILESIADSFFALDRGGRFRFATSTAGELLGKGPAELIGQTFVDVLPELRESELHTSIDRALRDRSSIRFDQFHARVNRWFEHQIYVQADGGIAVHGRDITRHKRAEVRLRLLVEATKILSASLDIQKMLHELAHFLAGHLGDFYYIYVREDDELIRVAAAARAADAIPELEIGESMEMR